jgi:hypothetical protein
MSDKVGKMSKLTQQEMNQRAELDLPIWIGRVTFQSSAAGLNGWDAVSAGFETEAEAREFAESLKAGKRRPKIKVFRSRTAYYQAETQST